MRVRPTRMSTEMFGAGAGSGWWSHLAHTWNRPGIRKPFKALCRVLRLWRKTWLIESVPLSHQWSRLPLRTLDLADKRCLQEGGGTHHRWTLSCYNRLLTRLLRRPHGRIADLPSGCRLALRPCATLQGALENSAPHLECGASHSQTRTHGYPPWRGIDMDPPPRSDCRCYGATTLSASHMAVTISPMPPTIPTRTFSARPK